MYIGNKEVQTAYIGDKEVQDIYFNGQSIFAKDLIKKLGILPENLAFFQSFRKGVKGKDAALLVRRASDSKTSVIPYRPRVAYSAQKNEFHYNPNSWAEWTLSADVIGTGDGLEIIAKKDAYIGSEILTKLKSETKYVIIFNIVRTNLEYHFTIDPNGLIFVGGQSFSSAVGYTKRVLTTKVITTNKFRVVTLNTETTGNSIVIKDMRLFELPAGSQIEADADNLTADEFNAKYPMCTPNGAPYKVDVPVQEVEYSNIVTNGDFSDGITGWAASSGCVLSANNNTLIITGSGENANAVASQTTLDTYQSVKNIYRRIGKFRVTNANCTRIAIEMRETNWYGTVLSTFVIFNPIQDIWYYASAIGQTGSNTKLTFVIRHDYADAATADGKVLEVQEVMAFDITDMGINDLPLSAIRQYFPFTATTDTATIYRYFYSLPKSGIPKDRICNQFINGDGRYGAIGFAPSNAIINPVSGGGTVIGNGLETKVSLYLNNGSYSFRDSEFKKHYIRAKVKRPAGSTTCIITVRNGVSSRFLDLSSVPDDEEVWISGTTTQTALGTNGGIQIFFYAAFPDTATQADSVFSVKYCSIIDKGNSSADPLYDKTDEEMLTWLSQQPNAIPVEGSYYLPPYGLASGELDLDTTAAFGVTSQLYVAEAVQQETHILGLNQILLDGNLESGASWNGYEASLVIADNVAYCEGDGSANYVGARLYNATASPSIIGNKYYVEAEILAEDALPLDFRIFVQFNDGSLQTSFASYSGSYFVLNDWGKFGGTCIADTADYVKYVYVAARYADVATQSGKKIQIRNVRMYPVTEDFGAGYEPTNVEMGSITSVDGDQYWEGVKDVDCSVAFRTLQTTASYQPKLYDSGLHYPYGLYSGSQYLVADLPNITNAPCTWWTKINSQEQSYCVFSKALDNTLAQYGFVISSGLCYFLTGAGYKTSIPIKYNKDMLCVFTWDGTTLMQYVSYGDEVIAGTGVAFSGEITSQPYSYIGCKSTSSDGSTRGINFKGEIQEIGIATQVLTPEQIQKLWEV